MGFYPLDRLGDAALHVFDAVASAISTRAVGTPVKIRMDMSPGGAIRGRIDQVSIETADVSMGLLSLDKLRMHVDKVAIVPAFPPRIETGQVSFVATVGQAAVDAWTRSVALPLRIRFRKGAIVTRAGIAGLRLGEMEVDLAVDGRLLRLIPRRVSVLGLEMTTPSVLQGALPLPPLPRGLHLSEISPGDRELVVQGVVGSLSEPLTRENLRRVKALVPERGSTDGRKGKRGARDEQQGDQHSDSRPRRDRGSRREIDHSLGNGHRHKPSLPGRTPPPRWE